MDDLKDTASKLLAEGEKQARLLARHGPAAVRDGLDSYARRTSPNGAVALLVSWNDTATKRAIVEFVEAITSPDSADYIPPDERIAIFDNDGTLWPEKPMPIQLAFTIQRMGQQAEADPALRDHQPWKAAHEQDFGWFNLAVVKHYQGDDSDLGLLLKTVPHAFASMTIEQFKDEVKAFFKETPHPTLNRPYASLGYQPMVELLRYLESAGFQVYIASGGDRDFMRGIAEEIYGIPPERVVGSAFKLEFREHEDSVDVIYTSEMDFFDDGPEKPVRIWSRIGRRPVVVGGNSNGDIEMMRFANVAGRRSLRLLVHHDDGDREFAYNSGAEKALERAGQRGWTVISIRRDWNTVFADGG